MLKPCPFHKHQNFDVDVFISDASLGFYVQCECGARGPEEGTKELAILAWNTRADEERIRRETIEECAEVAETHFSETTWHLGETEPMTIMREIANEIRALAEPKEAEDGN